MIEKFMPGLKTIEVGGNRIVDAADLEQYLAKKMVFSTIEGDHIVQKIELSHIVRLPSAKEAEIHQFLRELNTPESMLLARKIELGGIEQ
jgi:hypothetical protein